MDNLKENTNLESIINTQLDTVEEQENRNAHSIFDYLKERPGVLATGISALIAIVAFIFNAALYNVISKYLQYWGISPDNVSVANANLIYILVSAMIYFIAIMFMTIFLFDTYNVYQRYYNKIYCMKLILKDTRKRCKKAKRAIFILNLSSIHVKLFRKNADNKQFNRTQKSTTQQRKELALIEDEEKELSKIRHSISYMCFKMLLPSLVFAFITVFLFISIFSSFYSIERKYTVLIDLVKTIYFIIIFRK